DPTPPRAEQAMANKPDDSSRPHPDDAGKHPKDPDAPVPGPKKKGDSDSSIDFDDLNEEGMSGISVIEWASLVENPDRPGSDPQPPKGAPPAAGGVTHPSSDEFVLPPEVAGTGPSLRPPTPPQPLSESEIDLSAHDYLRPAGQAGQAGAPAAADDNEGV